MYQFGFPYDDLTLPFYLKKLDDLQLYYLSEEIYDLIFGEHYFVGKYFLDKFVQ